MHPPDRDEFIRLARAGRTVAEALVRLGRERDDVRSAIHEFANWLAAQTRHRAPSRRPHDSNHGTMRLGHRHDQQHDDHDDDDRTSRPRPEFERVDFSVIALRARLKAEACRWAIERRRLVTSGAELGETVKPRDAELAARAEQLQHCLLWMIDSYRALPDDGAMEQIACNYETLGLAAELGSRFIDDDADLEPDETLLHLLAESQSSLRSILDAIDVRHDRDQLDLFGHLKELTYRHRIYVQRHMKLDDPADPAGWMDLQSRLRAYQADGDHRRVQRIERQAMLRRIAEEVGQLAGPHAGDQTRWTTLVDLLSEWKTRGYPVVHRPLIELLADVIDDMPETVEVTDEAEVILDATDRYLEQQEMAESGRG